jgi:hypothetical protein
MPCSTEEFCDYVMKITPQQVAQLSRAQPSMFQPQTPTLQIQPQNNY